MKKAIALFTVASLALLVAAPAAAFSMTVESILDDSMAKVKAKWDVKLDVENNNSTEVENDVEAESESGENEINSDDDMASVSVTSGNTDAAALADTTANTNSLLEDLNGAEAGTASVITVDDSSTVEAEVKDESKDVVENKNWIGIEDDVEAEAETGENEVNSGDSLTGASVASGAAKSAAGAVKLLNSNIFDKFRR